jgi:hypothetical protein
MIAAKLLLDPPPDDRRFAIQSRHEYSIATGAQTHQDSPDRRARV